jgi:hypothetical protein
MTKINRAWWNHSIDELEQAADNDGVVRDNKDYTRRNRFTGESIELTPEEAKKHDEIFYHEALATLEDKTLGTGGSKLWDKVRDNLDWFRRHNAKAYMVLLD